MSNNSTHKLPKLFWIVAIAAIVWNLLVDSLNGSDRFDKMACPNSVVPNIRKILFQLFGSLHNKEVGQVL